MKVMWRLKRPKNYASNEGFLQGAERLTATGAPLYGGLVDVGGGGGAKRFAGGRGGAQLPEPPDAGIPRCAGSVDVALGLGGVV